LLLLILNIPLIGLWIQILKVPYAILMPMIVLFCTIGAYSANSNITDIFVMLFFGAAGYLMKKLSFDAPAFILAFVLGPMLENSLRQALIISRGDLSIFVNRPISLACLTFAGLLLAWSVFGRKKLSQLPADD
jgi:putative tricarboxylic transport membrane protein